MKLRYYMRGLGIGVLVTAILMSVTLNGKTEKLSDEEIIARAEELGMVMEYDDVVLADTVSENQTEEPEEKPETVTAEEPEEKPETVTAEEPEEKPETVVAEEDEVSEEESDITSEEAQIEEIETDQTVEITVQGGDGSQTVARKLAQAGLIDDAQAYDKYLCSNGYDKRICTGTHTIPVGAGEEEIAKIITKSP